MFEWPWKKCRTEKTKVSQQIVSEKPSEKSAETSTIASARQDLSAESVMETTAVVPSMYEIRETDQHVEGLDVFKREVYKVLDGEENQCFIMRLNLGFFDARVPDTVGCFCKNGNWHVYYTDDRINTRISGPMSLKNAITDFIRELPISTEKKRKYQYEDGFFPHSYGSLQEALKRHNDDTSVVEEEKAECRIAKEEDFRLPENSPVTFKILKKYETDDWDQISIEMSHSLTDETFADFFKSFETDTVYLYVLEYMYLLNEDYTGHGSYGHGSIHGSSNLDKIDWNAENKPANSGKSARTFR